MTLEPTNKSWFICSIMKGWRYFSWTVGGSLHQLTGRVLLQTAVRCIWQRIKYWTQVWKFWKGFIHISLRLPLVSSQSNKNNLTVHQQVASVQSDQHQMPDWMQKQLCTLFLSSLCLQYVLLFACFSLCRYQSLNLTHVPEHSPAIYEFRWHRPARWRTSYIYLLFFFVFKNRDSNFNVELKCLDATEEVWSFGIIVLMDLLGRSLEEDVNVHGGETERWKERAEGSGQPQLWLQREKLDRCSHGIPGSSLCVTVWRSITRHFIRSPTTPPPFYFFPNPLVLRLIQRWSSGVGGKAAWTLRGTRIPASAVSALPNGIEREKMRFTFGALSSP